MRPLLPTYTAALFAPLQRELLALLRDLAPHDWERPTIAGAWRVRDVAAHILDVDLRYLSVTRDGHIMSPDQPLTAYGDIVGWISHLNAVGLEASRRMSTRVIVDLLDVVGRWVADVVEHLPPDRPAAFGVAWAGEIHSTHWMDIGREYTERWHHQAQIRDALGVPRLLDRRWLEPLLRLSVRALPVAYAHVDAPPGSTVTLEVTEPGSSGPTMCFTLARAQAGWQVQEGSPARPAARVQMAADDVWRLFYNALDHDAARRRADVIGDAALAAPLFAARSVMV